MLNTMMTYLPDRLTICLVLLVLPLVVAQGQPPKIEVIYPKPNQRIRAVDSTFIFGNVTPGVELTINGTPVKVYKNGAFLAYLSLVAGEFIFHLYAKRDGEAVAYDLPVIVPTPYRVPESDSLVIVAGHQIPSRDLGLLPGDMLDVSFRGTPGRFTYFRLSGSDTLLPLTETPPRPQSYWGEDLFGDGDIPDSLLIWGIYSGCLTLNREHIDDSTSIIYYLCRSPLTVLNCADSTFFGDSLSCDCISATNERRLAVLDGNEIVIGELVDSVQIIRTGPRKGYLSIFQPQGVRFRITGFYDNYLRGLLAPNQPAWVPDSAIHLLPAGTQWPQGEVVLVRTHKLEQGVLVSFDCGAKLPFRVEEDISAGKIILDIYNCISNIDWVRYDFADTMISMINWSQPQEGVMRLSIDLNQPLWGYDCYYEGSRFHLKLKSAPNLKWGLRDVRIVIDPGHSPDPGAIGPTGLMEKDANLAIALELAKILRKKRAKVFLTRVDDSPLGIYQRPELAYRHNADIFISVHNNALPDGVNPFHNYGTSTYYYHSHSKKLAEFVQWRMLKEIGYPDFGLYHANFAVNRPSGYLAILVECAFMMLPEHEMALRRRSFQEKIAESIADGICDFVKAEKKTSH